MEYTDSYLATLIFFELLRGIVLIVGFSTAFIFLLIGFKILQNGWEFNENREAVRMYNNGCLLTSLPYDYRSRVNPGIAVNIKTNTWVAVGSVSDEGIANVLY